MTRLSSSLAPVSDKDSAAEGETVTLTGTNDNDHRLVSIEAADENDGPVALEKIPMMTMAVICCEVTKAL